MQEELLAARRRAAGRVAAEGAEEAEDDEEQEEEKEDVEEEQVKEMPTLPVKVDQPIDVTASDVDDAEEPVPEKSDERSGRRSREEGLDSHQQTAGGVVDQPPEGMGPVNAKPDDNENLMIPPAQTSALTAATASGDVVAEEQSAHDDSSDEEMEGGSELSSGGADDGMAMASWTLADTVSDPAGGRRKMRLVVKALREVHLRDADLKDEWLKEIRVGSAAAPHGRSCPAHGGNLIQPHGDSAVEFAHCRTWTCTCAETCIVTACGCGSNPYPQNDIFRVYF